MRKKPTRPDRDTSQIYNSGVLTVYAVSNAAPPGHTPREMITPKVTIHYEEQRLGINRLYLSRQNQAEISRVVRVPRRPEVSTQDVVIDQFGKSYRIDTVQAVLDVWPASLDLSLRRVEQKYEVSHELV